jgi:hypothetical protein
MLKYSSSIFIYHIKAQDNTKSDDNKDSSKSSKDNENNVYSMKQRIKELELDLARAKVAQVEAECQNQNLKHQLINISNATKVPLQTNNSWKSKLENVVSSMNIPNMTMNMPSFQSHITDLTHFNSTEDTK